MADNFISKFAGLFVVLILVLVVAVPIVATVSVHSETHIETAEHEYVNDYDQYEGKVYLDVYAGNPNYYYSDSGPDVPLNSFSVIATTPEYWTSGPIHTAIYVSGMLNGSIYWKTGGSYWDEYYLPSAADPSVITFGPDGEDIPALASAGLVATRISTNPTIWELTVSDPDAVTLGIPAMYDYDGFNPTYITQKAYRASVDTDGGITYSPDPDGDYIAMPVSVLVALSQDVEPIYVQGGATIYGPDEFGVMTAFTAPDTSGISPEFDIAWATVNYDGTVYEIYMWDYVESPYDLLIPYEFSVVETVTVDVEHQELTTFNYTKMNYNLLNATEVQYCLTSDVADAMYWGYVTWDGTTATVIPKPSLEELYTTPDLYLYLGPSIDIIRNVAESSLDGFHIYETSTDAWYNSSSARNTFQQFDLADEYMDHSRITSVITDDSTTPTTYEIADAESNGVGFGIIIPIGGQATGYITVTETIPKVVTVTTELIPMGDLLVAVMILFAVILAVGLLARGGF